MGGMTGSNIALGVQAVGGLANTYSSYRKAEGEKQGYEYQATVARNNAQLAEWQAQDALERGKVTQGNVRMRGAQLRGTQEATFAARGIALNEGSALNILADTAYMTEVDARTAVDNSAREAWALRNQAKGYTDNAGILKARGDSVNPSFDAAGTLLTTGGKVASSWYAEKDKATSVSGGWTPASMQKTNMWDES